jgi:potassium efflux system protein
MDTLRSFLSSPVQIGWLGLSFTPLRAILGLLLPVVVAYLLYRLLLLLLRRPVLKHLHVPEDAKRRIHRITRLVLRVLLLISVLFIVLSFLGAAVGRLLGKVWEILTTPFVTAGSSRISAMTIVLAVPLLYLASWVSKLTRRVLEASVLRKLTLDEEVRFTIASLVRYGVLVVAILVGLSILGINLSSLAVLFGVLGIGLGFGLQNVVANYVAGLVIFLERPLKEGDRILVNNLEGDVVQIRLRSTVINTLTNETIIVPNSQLVNNMVHNYSYRDKRIVVVNAVQVSYGTDLEQAEAVLLEVAGRNPYALREPPPGVRVVAFQSSGIELALWTWIEVATQKLPALSWTNMEIWRAFKKAGVVIPFPQVDLHVKEPLRHLSLGEEPPEATGSG